MKDTFAIGKGSLLKAIAGCAKRNCGLHRRAHATPASPACGCLKDTFAIGKGSLLKAIGIPAVVK